VRFKAEVVPTLRALTTTMAAAILPAQLLTKTGLKATKEILANKRAVALYFSGSLN
jgi:hypothetical protein